MKRAMSNAPIIYADPDLSLDGPTFFCPTCHEPVELRVGVVQFTCENGHKFSWHEIYAFSVKYWAVMAWTAWKGLGDDD